MDIQSREFFYLPFRSIIFKIATYLSRKGIFLPRIGLGFTLKMTISKDSLNPLYSTTYCLRFCVIFTKTFGKNFFYSEERNFKFSLAWHSMTIESLTIEVDKNGYTESICEYT